MFIRDPNSYMREKLKGTYVPKELHFHVQLAGAKFPADTKIPQNQIVITTTIELDASFKEDAIKEIRRLQLPDNVLSLTYCDGCGECKVAIIK